MHTFFHGWRRKVGIVSLVMACGLTSAWMRSQFFRDVFCWSIGHEAEVIISDDGILSWWRLSLQHPLPQRWNPGFVNRGRDGSYYFRARDWYVELGESDSLSVPYWHSVIPLTLLSAYLILWKPRKRG
jgi:hypothetical protein